MQEDSFTKGTKQWLLQQLYDQESNILENKSISYQANL
jgi:hypothetical protein